MCKKVKYFDHSFLLYVKLVDTSIWIRVNGMKFNFSAL
jgi:hypothetical protein